MANGGKIRSFECRFSTEGSEVRITIQVKGDHPGNDLLLMAGIAAEKFINRDSGKDQNDQGQGQTGQETQH